MGVKHSRGRWRKAWVPLLASYIRPDLVEDSKADLTQEVRDEVCAHCNGDQVTPKDDYVSAVDGGECDVGMDRTPLGTSGSKEQHFFSSFHQQPIHHHHRHSQPQQSCRAMEITIFRTSILHYQLLHMAPTIINTISREWKIQIIMWLVESTTNSIY